MREGQTVVAKVFSTDWEAHIAQGVLEEHGIRSAIDNEVFGSILPIGFNDIGGIRLIVMAEDLERARELLDHCSSSGM